MPSQQYQLIWIASAFSILMVSPSWASEVVKTQHKHSMSSLEIPTLNEFAQPATTLDEWHEQIAQTTIVPITGIRLSTTDAGVEVILETAEGQLSEPSTSVVDNTLIVEIPNAVLELPDDEFQQTNPVEGIARISVTGLPKNQIRVAITGTNTAPTATVREEVQRLVLSVVPGSEVVEESEETIQVVVTAQPEQGYQVDRATTATRTETPLLDVPRSVQVVPQQVIEDQRVTTVGDALRNVSGIAQDSTPLSIFSDFIRVRGFTIGRDYFTNGIRNEFTGYNLGQETANIERIEVLKGPSSVLYSQGAPGGVINILTKQPLTEPYYAFDFTAGSFNSYRPTLDFSDSLNDARTILYRLNIAYQNSGTFVDDIDLERFFVAPVVSFQLGSATNLIVEGQYLNFSGLLFSGLPAEGTVISNPFGEVSRSQPLDNYPGLDNRDRSVGNIGYRLEHDFSENWSIRNAFRYEFLDTNEEEVFLNDLLEDNRTVTRGSFRSVGHDENYVFQTDVTGRFATGSLDHSLVIGTEFRRVTTAGELFNADVPPIDIFNPNDADSPPLDFIQTGDGQTFQNIFGFYAQDLISIGNQWKILLGGRLDVVDQTVNNFLTGEEYKQQDTAFSPQVGVVYRVAEPVSLFTSYSRSFAPSSADFRNADGSTFEPTRGEQFEAGIRTEFIQNRLIATLTAYHLTKQNVVTDDPNRPGFSIQIGEERSQGIELDVIGEVLPGFNIIASYAYTDAEITRDNSGIEGNRPYNVPLHSGSLWLTYEFQQGALAGLGFGSGIFLVGNRQGDLDNSFELPSYMRTDATIFYRRPNWEVALNVKNLFDVDYFESSFSRTSVIPGAPFTILGTVSVRF
ncbi:TonB-dependent siderophore receptor [Gloeocapsopsis crepidinum LEGE 06123]|uniref:TonB-dependent siderophore receptor n=3 Tax=Gloeocapsopsis crepidinum TaxID=693223 RepID=A0ABR9UZB9_9CHRO|nr:TonB-dependent siderophore receptor [Gloeocapsopsis crepidinum]MBE9193653.1 TonB-dependent siderophore receptor [Gloeocapsopsis crepidinum LEGE 06123]